MSQIKGKNTKPEILVRRYFHSKGLRFKLHDKKLAGKPDMVFPKYNTVIHIHGCFWHGHKGCRYFVMPKTRTEFWLNKINNNKKRDSKNILALKKDKWKIITIWECELQRDKRETTLKKALSLMMSSN